jgi:SAM-dependent methyltransferase
MHDSQSPAHRTYVGRPDAYDVLGASQFNLLTTMGLREYHTLLDVGCGSLRSGRLFITYLQKGNYSGVDPGEWLIQAAVDNELGSSVAFLKAPVFRFDSDFSLTNFSRSFDYIQAHSILTHISRDMLVRLFAQTRMTLKPSGAFVGTFKPGTDDYSGSAWVYPGLVTYRWQTIKMIARENDLEAYRVRWPHPLQSYFLMLHRDLKLSCFLKRLDRRFLFPLPDLVIY